MKFSTSIISLMAILGPAVATRGDTTHQGLQAVGNHFGGKATSDYKDMGDHNRAGRTFSGVMSEFKGDENKGIAGKINGAVGGVTPVKPKSHFGRRGLEFLGSDDTHEYFARSLDTRQYYARSLDADEDMYYDLYY